LTVVGYSAGGDFVYTQVGFVTLDTAIDFLSLNPPGQRTFFVIKLKDGTNVDSAAASLAQRTPGVKFIKPADFAHETRKRILGNILPILIVVLIISFIVGLAVAGLTIYTATIEKSREYGILKAEGFTNGYLYRVVFEQSLVTGLLGFLIGAGLTVVVAPFAQQSVPQFVVFVRWQDICSVAGATLIMSLLAAYIPVRRLTNIDPVSVFKG
jgi:putative ABC transport system permease protein